MTSGIWKLPRAKELCRRLIAEGLNTVPWVTVHGMKVNHTDLELFQLMKAAGCIRVGFGVENGDENMLRNVIRKGQTLDQVREAFANAKAANLQTMGFFIFGMPGDNEETMEKTIQLALELDPKLANFMLAAPFPGTVMYDQIQDGGQVFADNWGDFAIHEQKPRFIMNENYDPDLVVKKWRDAYRRFYLYRPERAGKDDVQGKLDQSARHLLADQTILHRHQRSGSAEGEDGKSGSVVRFVHLCYIEARCTNRDSGLFCVNEE